MEKFKKTFLEWEYKNMLLFPVLLNLSYMAVLFWGLPD